jgi:hypothetical protein
MVLRVPWPLVGHALGHFLRFQGSAWNGPIDPRLGLGTFAPNLIIGYDKLELS